MAKAWHDDRTNIKVEVNWLRWEFTLFILCSPDVMRLWIVSWLWSITLCWPIQCWTWRLRVKNRQLKVVQWPASSTRKHRVQRSHQTRSRWNRMWSNSKTQVYVSVSARMFSLVAWSFLRIRSGLKTVISEFFCN